MKFSIPNTRNAQKKDISIGLDIGSSYLKLLVLEKAASGIELDKYFIQPIPGLSQIPSLLKKIFTENEIPSNKVNISLSGKSTLVRDLWVPQMSHQELEASLKYELDQYVPFPAEEVYSDNYILDSNSLTRKEGQMRVILAVAKKKLIENYMAQMKQAGLALNVIDMDALALFNVFCGCNPGEKEKVTVALVDIGSSKSIIDILSEGVLVFTREVEYGVGRVRDGISKEFNISKEESDKLICIKDTRIENWVQTLVDKLGKELWSSFEYAEGQEQRTIEKIYLTGGGSLLPGLIGYLGETITLPVEIWNPLKNIKINLDSSKKIDLEKIAPLMAVVYGAACRGL